MVVVVMGAVARVVAMAGVAMAGVARAAVARVEAAILAVARVARVVTAAVMVVAASSDKCPYLIPQTQTCTSMSSTCRIPHHRVIRAHRK